MVGGARDEDDNGWGEERALYLGGSIGLRRRFGNQGTLYSASWCC